jgi:hypothetical protein
VRCSAPAAVPAACWALSPEWGRRRCPFRAGQSGPRSRRCRVVTRAAALVHSSAIDDDVADGRLNPRLRSGPTSCERSLPSRPHVPQPVARSAGRWRPHLVTFHVKRATGPGTVARGRYGRMRVVESPGGRNGAAESSPPTETGTTPRERERERRGVAPSLPDLFERRAGRAARRVVDLVRRTRPRAMHRATIVIRACLVPHAHALHAAPIVGCEHGGGAPSGQGRSAPDARRGAVPREARGVSPLGTAVSRETGSARLWPAR